MENIREYSRQGDVYLHLYKDEELPKNLEWKEVKEVILAHGEKTGHTHQLIAEGGSQIWIAKGFNNETYIKTTKGVRGYHPEHDPKGYEIKEGFHKQIQEIEYDYLSKKNKQVVD